jgi:hypothetical protein
MLITALFTIVKTWKQLKCLSVDEWKNKMWHMLTVEYYSALKRREILSYTTKWIHLSEAQWLMPVIPVTQEAEVCRITVAGQPGQKLVRAISTNKKVGVVMYACHPSYMET